jgi:hypothetical protein
MFLGGMMKPSLRLGVKEEQDFQSLMQVRNINAIVELRQ